MKGIVESITEPGDVVLDPFAGSGSTGVACALLGRRFIGCELVEEYAKVETGRLRKVTR